MPLYTFHFIKDLLISSLFCPIRACLEKYAFCYKLYKNYELFKICLLIRKYELHKLKRTEKLLIKQLAYICLAFSVLSIRSEWREKQEQAFNIFCIIYELLLAGMFLFWNRNTASARQSALRCRERLDEEFIEQLDSLHDGALRTGLVSKEDLHEAYRQSRHIEQRPNRINMWYTFGIMAFVMLLTPIVYHILIFLLGVKCFLPNNHLVWEATRPISDCGYCRSVQGPLILKNISRKEFAPYAYSSLPIVIKNAVSNWPASKHLNLKYLKKIYERHPDSLEEGCHFLHFHSDLKSIKDVFNMPEERANLSAGSAWYVGWSNCHPGVLNDLRKLYGRPHFLPEDAELSNTDYIFLGYELGSYMHLDHKHRLMWQAQLKGNKSWLLAPTPECDQICNTFSFVVEPGDAVLVDTRIWYHGTSIPKGQFSMTIQSEYG